MTPLLPAVAGGLITVGLLGLVIGIQPSPIAPKAPNRPRIAIDPRTRMLLIAGFGLGLLGWVITGWVLAFVIAPVAVIGLPILLAAPTAAAKINPSLRAGIELINLGAVADMPLAQIVHGGRRHEIDSFRPLCKKRCKCFKPRFRFT